VLIAKWHPQHCINRKPLLRQGSFGGSDSEVNGGSRGSNMEALNIQANSVMMRQWKCSNKEIDRYTHGGKRLNGTSSINYFTSAHHRSPSLQ